MLKNTSKHFKIVLAIRFAGNLFFLTGLLVLVFLLGPMVGAEASYRKDKILGVNRTVANVITSTNASKNSASPSPQAGFSDIKVDENSITPVDTNFGIVIEKINANAKVVANVDPSNERQYVAALSTGVAEALGSTTPGQAGNLYLFSHSTDAPWNVVRYNAIFYLLRELEAGDRVIIFYQGKRFDYYVFDKEIVSPSDTQYLTNKYDKPVLTLQTCDPPGTLFNRLIVRAKLAGS